MKKVLCILLALLLALGVCGALAEEIEMEIEDVGLEDVSLGDVVLEDIAAPVTPASDMAQSNAAKTVKINTTNFPDAAFRKYVKDSFDTDGNVSLSPDEANAVTYINVGTMSWQEELVYVNLRSAKGIEFFPNLNVLLILGNDNKRLSLTKLDVSKNTKLETLIIGTNKVKTLTLGKKPRLEQLVCDNNLLTKLDVSKCPELNYLKCHDNKLTKLDVSKCKKLETLYCEANAIKKIDIAKLPAYLRTLARENEFSIGDGLMYIIPEEDKGLRLDASVKVYDGKKLIHEPA